MNRERASRAYDLIAEGFAELAIAVREAGSALPVPADPPEGFIRYEDAYPTQPGPGKAPPLKPQVDAGLSICPIHGTAWAVAPAGVSKRTGEEYDAFYKCSEKTGDEWCKQKPQKIWRDTHPIRESA